MNKVLKFIIKLLGKLAFIYGILFLVFFYDLDGKFMYYIWEPFCIRHFGRVVKPDSLQTPYGRKDKVAADEYSEIL